MDKYGENKMSYSPKQMNCIIIIVGVTVSKICPCEPQYTTVLNAVFPVSTEVPLTNRTHTWTNRTNLTWTNRTHTWTHTNRTHTWTNRTLSPSPSPLPQSSSNPQSPLLQTQSPSPLLRSPMLDTTPSLRTTLRPPLRTLSVFSSIGIALVCAMFVVMVALVVAVTRRRRRRR